MLIPKHIFECFVLIWNPRNLFVNKSGIRYSYSEVSKKEGFIKNAISFDRIVWFHRIKAHFKAFKSSFQISTYEIENFHPVKSYSFTLSSPVSSSPILIEYFLKLLFAR